MDHTSASEKDAIKKKSQRSPFFSISSLTNNGLEKKRRANRLVLTRKGGTRTGSGEREGRRVLRALLINSSYFGRGPSGPSCDFGKSRSCPARGARARGVRHTPAAARRRAVFSLTGRIFPRKKRGARAPGDGGDVLSDV